MLAPFFAVLIVRISANEHPHLGPTACGNLYVDMRIIDE